MKNKNNIEKKERIIIKSQKEIEIMAEAGKLLAQLFKEMTEIIVPGIRTWDIELFAKKFINKHNLKPVFTEVPGYHHITCVSVNNEVVHGIPSRNRFLEEGDIVSVDIGVKLNKYIADSTVTYPVGKISNNAQKLLDVTKECLRLGIEQVKPGNRIGDIGYAIQTYAESHGYSVIRKFVGHGVGRKLHEPPQIPHYGKKGEGLLLVEGMTFALEPMINEGDYEIKILDDGWTAVTIDGKLSAQFEHTVAVTKDGCRILTI